MIQIKEDNIIKHFGVYFIVLYNGKEYYCKKADRSLMFNEFIAEEIATQYGIDHAHYELGDYNGRKYIMSESVYDPEKEELLSLEDLYMNYNEDSLNLHLMDIWYFFSKYYPKYATNIMNKLVDLFLFDSLIGNSDRHYLNITFIVDKSDGSIRVSPIFDNEMIGEKLAINDGIYSLGVNSDSYKNEVNYLYDFLSSSNPFYTKYLVNKLGIISSNNLDSIFDNLSEKDINVPDVTRIIIKSSMGTNRRMIKNVINNLTEDKRLSLAM